MSDFYNIVSLSVCIAGLIYSILQLNESIIFDKKFGNLVLYYFAIVLNTGLIISYIPFVVKLINSN